MSKGCKKENTSGVREDSVVNSAKNDEQKLSLCSVIGNGNVSRWNRLRATLRCKTDEDFAKMLLDVVENQLLGNKLTCEEVQNADKENDITEPDATPQISIHPTKKKEHKHKRKKNLKSKDNIESDKIANPQCNNVKNDSTTINVKLENSLAEKPAEIAAGVQKNVIVPSEAQVKSKVSPLLPKKDGPGNIQVDLYPVVKKIKIEQPEEKKIVDEERNERFAIKIKMCSSCDTRHLDDQCPLRNPIEIADSITRSDWNDKFFESYNSEKTKIDKIEMKENDSVPLNKLSFSYISLPRVLRIQDTNTQHGLGVFCDGNIEAFAQLGPLVGKIVREVDIPEDCNMRHFFEMAIDDAHTYFNMEDNAESNWVKFIRPAPSKEMRNLLLTEKNNALYFLTVRSINAGEELLYWQEDLVATNKKKMEKTTCGGCNMTFLHPFYYRIHCSVFHDIRCSLTIRKYHCKVCGAAVLGKENIMKHAMKLHNGQGAYQCQFCKKFFLRLNYLEMHRTYGCSANPHRSRPLCDFCGRKFCQPQKLKVHIKRMHSDMEDVLKEFQCKNCYKILGSRAALQRHLKEVHQKQMDGAYGCNKCEKLFQNKSNLKIHMLTHSGIKPFKCAEDNCVAAFTTKQCLQFHYKKVHGFREEMMPKIERSIDYTFEAYSGAFEHESSNNGEQMDDGKGNISNSHDDDEDDDEEEEDSNMEEMNVNEPPPLHSPLPVQSTNSNASPPLLEAYAPNMKILSKGSKKWLGNPDSVKEEIALHLQKNDRMVEPPDAYNPTKLNTFNRHESSNASLLVEAALDSVCSDPNIDIDVGSTPNCTDSLVNNLYNLSHSDGLPDVTYNNSVDVNDSRDINLISPSVNDHISVTDDINDELHQSQNMGLDYSSFNQEDFSPPTSPSRINFVRDYINSNSPQNAHNYEPAKSPANSPPRYDFGPAVAAESDDSNGMGAQNLSLHNPKENLQLDLSIYKSHYNFDNINFMRKDLRSKFDEQERKQVYLIDSQKGYGEDASKFGMNLGLESQQVSSEMMEKDFEVQEGKHKDIELESSLRSAVPDIRNKFELDLDIRKSYDIDSDLRRTYDATLDDFRIKNYELDNLEIRSSLERNKTYESLIDEFRTDRNFEPLVLNPSELQGLDMSARGYHNYPNLNRYHHIYSEVERPSVDLRLNYSPPPPPPPPTYTHSDILRVVSLDLTPPGRHSVDLSLRSHQITNSRLLSEHPLQTTSHRLALDQSRLITGELSATRHLGAESRLISDMSNRILSDHTTNRILSNDQLPSNRLLTEDSRLLPEQPRLLSDGRILPPVSGSGSISPVPYSGYSVSPSPYHPTALAPRPHAPSPNPPSYHHYSAYY